MRAIQQNLRANDGGTGAILANRLPILVVIYRADIVRRRFGPADCPGAGYWPWSRQEPSA